MRRASRKNIAAPCGAMRRAARDVNGLVYPEFKGRRTHANLWVRRARMSAHARKGIRRIR
jgi:hypothetical protein